MKMFKFRYKIKKIFLEQFINKLITWNFLSFFWKIFKVYLQFLFWLNETSFLIDFTHDFFKNRKNKNLNAFLGSTKMLSLSQKWFKFFESLNTFLKTIKVLVYLTHPTKIQSIIARILSPFSCFECDKKFTNYNSSFVVKFVCFVWIENMFNL